MKFATKKAYLAAGLFLLTLSNPCWAEKKNHPFEELLRTAARANDFTPSMDTWINTDPELVRLGRKLFESPSLGLNSGVACRDCHLDQFSSGDGIPLAVGIGGSGHGPDRAKSDGLIVPRNTLPLWGRGGRGFDVFFWDGRVDFKNGNQISQFGSDPPSKDPFIVAIHLPAAEIREMIAEDSFVRSKKKEDAEVAKDLYATLVARTRQSEKDLVRDLAAHFSVLSDDIRFNHFAKAIANFIRKEFRLLKTSFENFVFHQGQMTEEEIRGGLIFYGKGRCSTCHSGSYFSDFSFHAVPFTQLGFGKNGFGIDYGRYNTTHDPGDLYKFRTPPLINVTETMPYGHSGSVPNLEQAIISHFDPLRNYSPEKHDAMERSEYYRRLGAGAKNSATIGYLDDSEVRDLVHFLSTLTMQ